MALLVLLQARKERLVFNIVLCAFLIRVLFMLVDYYHIFSLPGSGGDSEDFNQYALDNQRKNEYYYVTNYELFLTYLYALTDCSRLFAQYLNVLLGTLSLVFLNKSLKLMKIDVRTRCKCILLFAFLPNMIIFSSILLREAWIEFFIILSVYHFIKWFLYKKRYSLLFCFLCVLSATWMHNGCIALLIGYMICVVFYDRNNNRIKFSRRSIFTLTLMVLLMLFLFLNAETLFAKFGNLDEKTTSEIIEGSMENTIEAGSAYLTWLSYSNPLHLILFVPLKMFYFLFSPIPLDWRTAMDVFAFLMDSTFYVLVFYEISKYKVEDKKMYYLRFFLLLSFLVVTLMFSLGTIASGTAIRHRAKIFSLLVVCYGLSKVYGLKAKR